MAESRGLNVRLDAETRDAVERLAEEWGLTRSAVVRLAVRQLLISGVAPASSDAASSAL